MREMGLVCGCQLMTGPLDTEALRRSVENLSYGAVVTYCSEVPGTRQGAPVDTLTFTADEEQALLQMFAIAEQASKRWDANVAIAQRLGDLMPGEASLVVATACSDRQDAFDCCRFVCDGFAERVPVRIA
jgi:molybdopterin synthase catalytic subunit